MSLKMCAFASGSKGNCCYVSDGETDILIDLGISATHAEKCLAALGIDPGRVSIFVTHSHSDHIAGLKSFVKKHPGTAVHCQRESARGVFGGTGISPVIDGRETAIGNLCITALPVPHDVPCFGYVVKSVGGGAVAVVTDVGRVKADTLSGLSGCGLVMLEANHDTEMLRRNIKYTAQLKARIASPYGHLSNADCADACAFLASTGVKNFILAHLSEENNAPDLAVEAVTRALYDAGVPGARVTAAEQNKMTGLFEIC